jgi:hypothetical protein
MRQDLIPNIGAPKVTKQQDRPALQGSVRKSYGLRIHCGFFVTPPFASLAHSFRPPASQKRQTQ